MRKHFLLSLAIGFTALGNIHAYDPVEKVVKRLSSIKVQPLDWPQWGGSPERDNTPPDQELPSTWDVSTGENILWSMPLGSETYGNPTIANGKVYVGTNNASAYLSRYPANIDLGVLLCFNEADGKFLWQHSNEKLPTGRVHDWPDQGVCSAPTVDGDRLWYVTNRGTLVCLDVEGFRDNENDGPYQQEAKAAEDEADVIWELDMMKTLNISQHNMCSCSVTFVGDKLFCNTGNGVDESHIAIPKDAAPSFICVDRNTGKVLWQDNSPGKNILHGQWSSPAYGELGGVKQVIFAGGDGWLYGFAADGKDGKSDLLWKFDCNPKDSMYLLNRATRNHLIGTPVIYDGLVFIGVGEDPEHGEGQGHLWCIDPTKRGDVSPTLVYNSKEPDKPIAHKRLIALEKDKGDFQRDNPNSAAVWQYNGSDPGEFETTMHRTMGSVAIKNDILFVVDHSGVVHCLNSKTGEAYYTHDMLSESWGSPLIVKEKVYISNADGAILMFDLKTEKHEPETCEMESAVLTSPVAANNTLFIANRNRLFAIKEGAQSKPPEE